MNDTQQQDVSIKRHRAAVAFGIKLHEWCIAGALGLASGIATSASKIQELFYDDVKGATVFEPHFKGVSEKEWEKQVTEKYEKLCPPRQSLNQWLKKNPEKQNEFRAELESRPVGRQARLNKVSLKEFRATYGDEGESMYRKALRDVKRNINEDFKKYALEYRGISKNPIMGTINKLETLSPRSLKRLAFNGSLGVALGAAMTISFFNGVATRDKIDRIAAQTGADQDVDLPSR